MGRNPRKADLILLTVLCLLFFGRPAHSDTELIGVRSSYYPRENNKTRIVFDFSGRPEYTVLPRSVNTIVVLKKIRTPGTGCVGFDEGLVEEVRFEDTEEGTAAVLSLRRSAVNLLYCYLEPNDDFPNHRLVLDFFSRPATSVRRKCVILDPGHGGWNDGCRGNGKNRNLVERNMVLDLAKRVEKCFKDNDNKGSTDVFLTRTDDVLPFISLGKRTQKPKYPSIENRRRSQSLAGRTDYAEEIVGRYGWESSVFVSIHVNWVKEKQVHGYEVYVGDSRAYSTGEHRLVDEQANLKSGGRNLMNRGVAGALRARSEASSRRLARYLGDGLDSLPGMTHHGGDKGLAEADFAVLRTLAMPAVLVEVGFVSNPEEARRLGDPNYMDRVAKSIHSSLVRYFVEVDKNYPLKPVDTEVYYTVRNGDSLSVIASKYKVTVQSLMAANRLKSYVITPGMVLKILR